MSEKNEEDNSMSVRSNNSPSIFKILSSYNSNVLLAALIFLLLVILFVLLLHFYARFFWSHSRHDLFSAARRRRRRRRRQLNRIRTFTAATNESGVSSAVVATTTNDEKGLDSSLISSIPLFVYDEEREEEEEEEEEECVICLGLWEVGDLGRKLRSCGHGFHVECIDMWLSSHSTCPICRSSVLATSASDSFNGVEEEVRLQRFPTENITGDDQRVSVLIEDDVKTGEGVGEGEVRIEVIAREDEEINGGGSMCGRRSTSSASSSLMRILSSRVFPSARQDSSS